MKKAFFLMAVLLSAALYSQISTDDFVTTWKTDNFGTLSNDSTIYILASDLNFTFNYDVDWNNDGIFDSLGVTGSTSHQYTSPGTYTIRIRGDFPRIEFGASYLFGFDERDALKLISIDQWGDMQWEKLDQAFVYCKNLNIVATDAPILDNLLNGSLQSMFEDCVSFNASINHWDVSDVNNTESMFKGDTSFNQPLNSWDVSSVTSMSYMFDRNYNFNQTLESWDVSNVVSMISMFQGARDYNQPMNNWDVSDVTIMSYIFESAISFNQPLKDWDVGSLTYFQGIFYDASSFNQNLGDWDISSILSMNLFLQNSGLSTENYDSTLLGWYNQNPPNNIYLDAGGLKYCNSEIIRDSLLAIGWNISGDTLDPNCSKISIDENSESVNQVFVYPNPSSGSFKVQLGNDSFIGELKIYTLNGKLIHQQHIENQAKIELEIDWKRGIYFLWLSSQQQNLGQRIIIL